VPTFIVLLNYQIDKKEFRMDKYIIKCGDLIVKADDENDARKILSDEYYLDNDEIILNLKRMAGDDEYNRCNLRDIAISVFLATKTMNKKGKVLFKAYLKNDAHARQDALEIEKQKEAIADEEYKKELHIRNEKEKLMKSQIEEKIINGQLESGAQYYLDHEQIYQMKMHYIHLSTNNTMQGDDLIKISYNGENRQYKKKTKNQKRYCVVYTKEYTPLNKKTQYIEKADIVVDGIIVDTIILTDIYCHNYGYGSMISEHVYYDSMDALITANPSLNESKACEWFKRKQFKNKKTKKEIKPSHDQLWVDARGTGNNTWEGRYVADGYLNTYEVIANSSNEAELQALLIALQSLNHTGVSYDVLMDNEWVINGVQGASYSYNWYQFDDIKNMKNIKSINKKNRSVVELIWNN